MQNASSDSPEQRILDATLRVLAKHKISGTRMHMIAKECGMSQGNLHYYFATKDLLFHTLLQDILAKYVSERKYAFAAKARSPVEKLAVFFDQMKRLLKKRNLLKKVTLDFWVQSTRDPALRKEISAMYATWRRDIREVVEEGVRSGAFSPKYQGQVPALMVSIMEGAALQSIIDPSAVELDAYFDGALRFVLLLLKKSDV